MEPEYTGSGSGPGSDSEGPKTGLKWRQFKQMGHEEKKAAITDELKRMQKLPPNSSYAAHRLRLLYKIQQVLSLQRVTSQDEELELLFSGLHI